MSAFPVPADHWHASAERFLGRVEIVPDRLGRMAALALVRHMLVNDLGRTGNPWYWSAIAAIDSGCELAIVGDRHYVAFACACPLTPAVYSERAGLRYAAI